MRIDPFEQSLASGLQDLIETWMRSKPLFTPNPFEIVERDVPPHLAASITRYEPYRVQALADARIFLGIPLMAGIGLEFEIPEPIEMVPFAQWAQTISPLRIRLTWMRTMAGDIIDTSESTIARVGREAGEWRIISFFDEADRQAMAKWRSYGAAK